MYVYAKYYNGIFISAVFLRGKMRKVSYLWFTYLLATANGLADDLIVPLDDGLIQGVQKTSFYGRTYFAFEGIPYAAPPIGVNRFKEPQPVKKWNDLLLANKTYTCSQFGQIGVIGTEDCLYLNVYIPRDSLNSPENVDVVVHIHGGAFMMGNANSFSGPAKIMDRDVIYVTFNYRLGALGFLATEDNTFPGNYGMKDQVMALKWVQKNIKKFGGNPQSVTLIGLSAGGASVHLHFFNQNHTEVLFHRAWAESGSALDPWVLRERTRSESSQLIKNMGCNHNTIAHCMRQKSAEDIINGTASFYYDGVIVPLAPFGPVIEEENEKNPYPFLTIHPYKQLKAGHSLNIPFIISQATHEGLLPSVVYYNRIEYLNKEWNTLLPLMLEYYDTDKQTQNGTSTKIKHFYFKDENLSRSNFDALIKVCSERMFHMGAEVTAKLEARSSSAKTYFMLFGYKGPDRSVEKMFNITDIDGVMHAAEGMYLYDSDWSPLLSPNFTPEQERVQKIMLDFLASFAQTGVPRAKDVLWDPVSTTGNLKYLLVKNPDELTMNTTEPLGVYTFWNSLNLTHNIYDF